MALLPFRAWARTEDPTGGLPLDDLRLLPRLDRHTVRSDDGAAVDLVTAGDGAGAPVVFSHCWTGDRRVWGPVARRLVVAGHRVALYDQRGHGTSTIGGDGLTMEALGADLAAVLEYLDARTAVVAGHSMGGMAIQALAAGAAERAAGRVGAAVLVATACAGLRADGWHRHGPRVVGARGVERLLAHHALGPLAVRDYVGRRPCLSHLRAVTETFLATPAEVRVGLLEAMLAMDLTGSLAGLGVPVTVVVGDADRHTPPHQARRIVEAVPGARLVVVPGAGHMLPFEAPDLVAGLVAEAAGAPLPHVPDHLGRHVAATPGTPSHERSV